MYQRTGAGLPGQHVHWYFSQQVWLAVLLILFQPKSRCNGKMVSPYYVRAHLNIIMQFSLKVQHECLVVNILKWQSFCILLNFELHTEFDILAWWTFLENTNTVMAWKYNRNTNFCCYIVKTYQSKSITIRGRHKVFVLTILNETSIDWFRYCKYF